MKDCTNSQNLKRGKRRFGALAGGMAPTSIFINFDRGVGPSLRQRSVENEDRSREWPGQLSRTPDRGGGRVIGSLTG